MNVDFQAPDAQPAGRRQRRWVGPTALAAGGLLAGAVLAGTVSASAAGSSTTSPSTGSSNGAPAQGQPPRGAVDESKSLRQDEHLLTGDTASKVRAAALAKDKGATILRVETDSDGVYEAHLVTSSGQRVTVEVDKSFAVTGTEAGGPHGGGRGDHDGDGPGGQPPAQGGQSSGTSGTQSSSYGA